MSSHILGKVVGLYRYPVKSMHGEAIAKARVGWHGIEGDRRYAFLRTTSRSHFPWLTAREIPQLLTYHPTFDDNTDPTKSPVRVTTPDGMSLPISDPDLQQSLEQLAGEPINLIHLGRGAYDSTAISLISTKTLETLAQVADTPLDPQRFRPNILIATEDNQPYPEDGWLGALLTFGEREDSIRIRVIRPIQRCMIINLDPDTGHQNPLILRSTVKQHDRCAGIYGVPEHIGTIEVGDSIVIQPG